MLKKTLLIAGLLFLAAPALFADSTEHMTGAYVTADPNDSGVIEAAKFAVRAINKGSLVKIISARSQVVAGVNYDLLLEIAEADGKNHRYKAVVFVPLPVSAMTKTLISSQDLGAV